MISERTVILSVYGPHSCGFGHSIEGKLEDFSKNHSMSCTQGLTVFDDMLSEFKDIPLGSKIKVIMFTG